MIRCGLLLVLFLLVTARLDGQPLASDLAEGWRASGAYFTWTSTLPENQGRRVQVFHTCQGDAAKPTIVMLPGFPTSSFDFRLLAGELAADFRTCTLDFPGYGVSDKPAGGYRYTLADDAQLVWHLVTKVLGLRQFVLLSHDRGDSVALNFLQLYQAAPNPPFTITHQFLTNGNMYLPLANLTEFQKRMLDPATSAAAVKAASATLLAAGMGRTNYTPPLEPGDPEVQALAALFGYQSGVEAIPATIQYLNERKEKEVSFLEALARSVVPATIMWGVHDMVAPVRVADHVFNTALRPRAVPGAYWLLPCGNHYVQHDQPADLARIIRLTLSLQTGGKALPAAPFNLSTDRCGPVLVAREQPSGAR
jgi:pimeloyl-ACP methyl ester carboxylesterase